MAIFKKPLSLYPAAHEAFWGDFDNDNDFDICLVNESNNIELYENLGNGNFEFNIEFSDNINNIIIIDYDNDGLLDIITKNKFIQNTGDWNFTSHTIFIGIEETTDENIISVFDYDNDGSLNILFNNQHSAGTLCMKLFDNNGENLHTSPIEMPGTENGSFAIADWDNDHDLDFVLSGMDNSSLLYTELILNNCETANTPPSTPSNLQFTCSEDTVFISWDKAIDLETPQDGLTYNCYMYEIGGDTIWHSLSNQGEEDPNNGKRYITKLGNVQYNTSWFITGLEAHKIYAWSVQAIDNSFEGGNFATEQTFRLAPIFVIEPVHQTVCENGSIMFNTATTPAISYQWCRFTATDTIFIDNNEYFSNATSTNLTISNATLDMHGYELHCKATSIGGDTYSAAAVLFVDEFIAAEAGSDTTFCDGSFIANANLPIGVTGEWICSNTDIIISDINSNTATFSDLPTGTTNMRWVITQDNVCGSNFDSMILTREVSVAQASQPSGETNCVNGTLEYETDAIFNATSYIWDLQPSAAGIIIENGIYATIHWNSSFIGTASITVAGQNSCSETNWSEPLIIDITGMPEQAELPTGEINICSGTANTNYTIATIIDITIYEWRLSPIAAGSVSGTGTTASVLWNAAFSGNASIKVRGTACENGEWSDELDIIVYNGSPESLNIPNGVTELCINNINTNYSVQTNINADSYMWDLSDDAGTISQTGNSIEINWNNSFVGTARLKVKGVNICGEGDWSEELSITITDIPSTASIPDGEIELCMNENSAYLISSVAYATSYIWEVYPTDAGEIVGTGTQITSEWQNNFSGSAYLKVKAINQCGDGAFSDSLKIEISSPIVQSIYQKSESMLISLDSGFVYQWYLNDEAILGANKQYYYNENMPSGNYSLELIDSKECRAFSEIYNFENTNRSLLLDKTIKIYPNPAINIITIEIDNDLTGELKYIITDNLGRTRNKSYINKAQSMIVFDNDITGLESGSYRIEFIFENKASVSKHLIIK